MVTLNQVKPSLSLNRPRKFLVVEDDFAAQPIWEMILRKVDPRALIRWATSEEGAEELMNKQLKDHEEFDLVICDIFLSGKKTGVDLWKKFSKLTNKTQFIFTSGIDYRNFVKMIGDVSREQPYLVQKPFQIVDGLQAINTALKYSQYFKN